jgi:hypothetical protein
LHCFLNEKKYVNADKGAQAFVDPRGMRVAVIARVIMVAAFVTAPVVMFHESLTKY